MAIEYSKRLLFVNRCALFLAAKSVMISVVAPAGLGPASPCVMTGLFQLSYGAVRAEVGSNRLLGRCNLQSLTIRD